MSSSGSNLLLSVERVDLISLTTVEGALYGFTFALYIFCARTLYLQLKDQDRRKQHLFTLVFMSFAMALSLFGVAVDARDVQTSYIDHADYPGGGYTYSNEVFETLPLAIASSVAYLVFSLMMSGIQIWRLWIVWRTSRYSLFVVILPVLSLLAYLVLDTFNVVVLSRTGLTPRPERLFYYGEIAFPLYITVTVTVLITARIFMVSRSHVKIMGQTDSSKQFTSVISMLVESFALETVWMAIQLFGDIHPPGADQVAATVIIFLYDTLPFIQLLAYLLVVHRVSTGRAWKEDTAEKLTTLQWNREGL